VRGIERRNKMKEKRRKREEKSEMRKSEEREERRRVLGDREQGTEESGEQKR
jgi:hypothetical protein